MKKLIYTVVLTFGVLATSNANAQKIAHINRDSLVQIMPEAKAVKDSVNAMIDKKQKSILYFQNEVQKMYDDYLTVSKDPSISEDVKKIKEEMIRQNSAKLDELRQSAQQEIQEYQVKLVKPIEEKVKVAIEKVAKAKGIKIVLDTTPQITSVLYSEPSEDIFNLVKLELKIPDAPKASTNTAPAGK